jgi:L-asparaginase
VIWPDVPELAVVSMGGTIDKIYSVAGEMEIGPPAASELLAMVGLGEVVPVIQASVKDSLDLTEADRAELLQHLRRLSARGVVITHGSDTLTVTAEYLQRHAANLEDKTIVLTGAVQPASMRHTDAGFNLGAALMAAQTLPSGIYVAMNGRAFVAGRVVKDRQTGRFVSDS